MKEQTVFILVGNIGTGKTTWTKDYVKINKDTLVVDIDTISTMLSCTGSYYFELDKLPLYSAIKESVLESVLRYGYSCILDGTHVTVSIRESYINKIKEIDKKIKIILVDFGPGSEVSLKRRQKENRGKSKELWRSVHKRFYLCYEKPSYLEKIDDIIEV